MQEYTLDFELSGPNVPVDEVFAPASQASAFKSWRIGEAVSGMRLATTSGVRIKIASRLGKRGAEEELERFFSEQAQWLDRLSGIRSAGDEQFVRCIMCVYPDNASYLELSEAVLHGLARTRTTFLVAAWPCDPTKATHERGRSPQKKPSRRP
jgi:hypothetical protein